MELKKFLNMAGCKDDYIEIQKNDEKIYLGTTQDYLVNKESINGTVKDWFVCIKDWEYPVMVINIE